VSREEVERLQAEGLPSLPRPLPEAPSVAAPSPGTQRRRNGVTLLAEPSQDAIDSADEVLRLANEIKAIELRRQREEALDWFRERAAREAEQLSAEQLRDQQERAKIEADRQHESWLKSWEAYALQRLQALAYDAAPEVRLDLHSTVRERLSSLHPMPAAEVVRKLVDAEVEKACQVWRARKETAGAVEYAMRRLPWDVQHNSDFVHLKLRALKAAAEAVDNIPGSDRRTKEELAVRAVQPITDQYEHIDRASRIVRGLASLLPGATAAELQEANRIVAEALAKSPLGTDKVGMEKIRNAVVTPVRDQVIQRQRQEEEKLLSEKQARAMEQEAARQKREALELRSAAERRVDCKLFRVDDCLRELERKNQIVFDSFPARLEIGQKLKSRIREILVQQIVQKPQLSEEIVRKRIDALTIKHVEDFTD